MRAICTGDACHTVDIENGEQKLPLRSRWHAALPEVAIVAIQLRKQIRDLRLFYILRFLNIEADVCVVQQEVALALEHVEVAPPLAVELAGL